MTKQTEGRKIRENLTREERDRLEKYGAIEFKSAGATRKREAPGALPPVPACRDRGERVAAPPKRSEARLQPRPDPGHRNPGLEGSPWLIKSLTPHPTF